MMRTSLRNLRYTRTMYCSRSRDLAARKTRRATARDRKKSVKVECFAIFAFWRFRRCDPPYPWSGTPFCCHCLKLVSIQSSPKKNAKIFLSQLCTSCRARRCANLLESFTTCRGKVFMITVHSIFSNFHFQKNFQDGFWNFHLYIIIFHEKLTVHH